MLDPICLSFLRFTDSDYLPLVPSNSSCEIETGISASIALFCVICIILTFDTSIVYNVCILRVYDTLMLILLYILVYMQYISGVIFPLCCLF